MKPIEKIVIWTWPDTDHEAASANGMCVHPLHEWKTVLAHSMEQLERDGHAVAVVTIPVAEMLAALSERGLANTPDNRAAVAVEWYSEQNE